MSLDVDVEGFGRWSGFSRVRTLYELIEGPIHREIYKQIKGELTHEELFKLTCGVVRPRVESITGDKYLAEKAVRYKITGTIKVEAELVDDRVIEK